MKQTNSQITVLILCSLLSAWALPGQRPQRPDLRGIITEDMQAPRIAVPDMPGPGDLSREISAFNNTLWNDLESSAQFQMVSKSLYPRTPPRRPEDLKSADQRMPADKGAQGFWLRGWSDPPATTRYLTFGSLDKSGERLVLSGYLYDAAAEEVRNAHIFGKRYFSSLDIAGARQVAHEFARDISQNLGLGMGLAGTRIYFVSDRTGHKEIWGMGLRRQQRATDHSIREHLHHSGRLADGSRIAFTTYVDGLPGIYVHSLENKPPADLLQPESLVEHYAELSPQRSADRIRVVGHGPLADLHGRPRRTELSAGLLFTRAGSRSGHQSQDRNAGRVHLGPLGPPAGLRHGHGRGECPHVVAGRRRAVQAVWDPQGENVAFAWTRGSNPATTTSS